jgi:hypothetical protein
MQRLSRDPARSWEADRAQGPERVRRAGCQTPLHTSPWARGNWRHTQAMRERADTRVRAEATEIGKDQLMMETQR